MQRRITRVWHRFAYTTGALVRTAHVTAHQEQLQKYGWMQRNPEDRPSGKNYTQPPVYEWPYEDDAFATILQWLYSKIPETRHGVPTGHAT
eukprot:gene6522-3162_t